MATTPKEPDLCERCGAEMEPSDFGETNSHGIEDCVKHLGAENASLKAKVKDLEERFERVLSRHELDDSKYGRGFY